MKDGIKKLRESLFFLLILFLVNKPLFGRDFSRRIFELNPMQDSTLRLLKDSSQIMLSFETGFAKSSVSIRNKNKEVIFKGILTTIPQLSLSKKIFVKKNEFPITIECEDNFTNINRTEFKFIYIKRVDSKLLIDYSQKFKIYE
jgi:hypothetical protein